jgi:hypothetical protein
MSVLMQSLDLMQGRFPEEKRAQRGAGGVMRIDAPDGDFLNGSAP